MSSLTVPELALWQRGGFAFTLLDVRRGAKRVAEGDQIAGTRWLDPALWLDWKDDVPKDRPAVVYCAYGHEISQGLTAALRALGVDARHLDGGIEAWRTAGQSVGALKETSS
jgi:thiosulfate sulfurtransferase